MTLTYIFHSGFVLETEQSILVFDYWMDPSGVMDGVLRSEKPMYVFSSHFHEDHFTKDIFEWKKLREGITYILSKDIYKHRRASKEDADVWLAKGGMWSDDTISVWALGSTDSGVSWIVETEDKAANKREQSQACLESAERKQARPKVKRIFHAGDLNNWYAKFLSDDNPDQQRYSFEMEEVFNPIAHEKQIPWRAEGHPQGCRQFRCGDVSHRWTCRQRLYPWWPAIHRAVQGRTVRSYALHYRFRIFMAHEGIY